MIPAISYARFSAKSQGKGDSESRQADTFTAFCKQHNLTPTLSFIDRGLSGGHGHHRSKGHFGRLLELVKANKVAKGTVIVIEAWDRFSRERIDISFPTVCELLRAGVKVGVGDLFEIFQESDIDTGKVNMIFSDLQRARRDWLRRQDMGKRAAVKARASGKKTAACPSWLKLEQGQYVETPYAETMRAAIKLSLNGYGWRKICEMTGANNGIHRLLRSRTLIGELTYTTGQTALNHYPALIDEGTFAQLQNGLDSRKNNDGSGKASRSPSTNLFTGLLFSGNVALGICRQRGGSPIRTLKAKGKGVGLLYEVAEFCLLSFIEELTASDVVSADDAASKLVGKLQEDLAKVEQQAKLLLGMELTGFLVTRLSALQSEKDALQATLEQARRQVASNAAENLSEVQSVIDLLHRDNSETHRLKIKSLLVGLVKRVDVQVIARDLATATIELVSGMTRKVSIEEMATSGTFFDRAGKWVKTEHLICTEGTMAGLAA